MILCHSEPHTRRGTSRCYLKAFGAGSLDFALDDRRINAGSTEMNALKLQASNLSTQQKVSYVPLRFW
jgi:hypothetical protein